MKNLLPFLIGMLCSTVLLAQPQTGTTEMNKVQQSSLIYELPYNEDVLLAALENKMKDYGKLPKKQKGFYKYKNIVIPEISSKPITVFFSIDRKSKKDKENSILSMLIADEHEIVFNQDNNNDVFQRGKLFLNDFGHNSALASHQQQIAEQANTIKKAEKKLENLKSDASDLEKKMKKLQSDIADNQKDISKQEEELAAQKKILAELESQKPGE